MIRMPTHLDASEMKSIISKSQIFIGLLLVLAGCGETVESTTAKAPQQRQTAATLPATAIRVTPASIVDNQGFSQPIVAATLFIPHGWQTQGGIEWGEQYGCTNGFGMNWSAESPDGHSAIAILPQQQWEWNSYGQAANPACQIRQIETVTAYIQAVIGFAMPNARITRIDRRPDLERELADMTGINDTGFQRIEARVEAAEALIEFSTDDGVALRGNFIAGVQFTHIRTGDGGMGGDIESLTGFALPSFASYGPAASFDRHYYDGLRQSVLVNPAWEQQIAQHNTTMGRINSKGITDRAAIQNKANTDISRIQNEAWQTQQKSSAVRAREFINAIRGVDTYHDNSTTSGQVELSAAYDHAWRLDDGSYVLTSDPAFKPYQSLGIDGKPLSVVGK